MVFCKNCGTQVDDGLKFCPACGQVVDEPQDAFDGDMGKSETFDAGQQYDAPIAQPYDPNQQYGGQQYGGDQFGGQQGYGAPMGGGMAMGIPERNIVTCILLTIVTCGIYGIYWMYCLTEDTNKISTDPNPASGGMAILLSIVTCGIYTYYWMYKRGDYIDKYNAMRGRQSSNGILYLVLTFFGLGIVSYCMMQNELNQMAHGL